MDEQKSVIVCAPTSSGKTVISTYVAVKVAAQLKAGAVSEGVLFVVPSEPLVWQVGFSTAHSFHSMFSFSWI